jgi:hypothetical protein
MYGLLSLQDFDKLVDAYHVDVGKWCLFENIIVMVFCNDIAGISLESDISRQLVSRTIFITACMACACVQTSTLPSRCR